MIHVDTSNDTKFFFYIVSYVRLSPQYTFVLYIPAFRNEFPGEEVPTPQTIYRIAEKFNETGSVEDAPPSVRPKTARTEENAQVLFETFLRNPQSTQRSASREFGISQRSLGCIMQDLNLKPYKPRLSKALNEDDKTLLDRILWTDEATFQTNGRVNRHNCVYWSDTNPHLIIEQELNVPRVIVWGGIWCTTPLWRNYARLFR